MHPLSEWRPHGVRYVFTDIDDTLTNEGKLEPLAYTSLWELHHHGFAVIPVTGRPAGWCEMIARFWPVYAVVGENGGFYFRHTGTTMKRHFAQTAEERSNNRQRLDFLANDILRSIPGTQIASDQFCRLLDLAIDFSEDVAPKLPITDAQKIVDLFKMHGAQAKISSIHVNGWFGQHEKLSMCQILAQRELGVDMQKQNSNFAFVGDSPNDEPMFAFFKNSLAVANIKNFTDCLVHQPKFVSPSCGGNGFHEIATHLISQRQD